MKKIKFIAAIVAGMLVAASCTGCAPFDVIGKYSVTSFDEILKTIPDKVQADESNAGWALSAPDDSARFIWRADYSKSPLYDVMLAFDAQPFLQAGLDPDKLPENYVFSEDTAMGGAGSKTLTVGKKLGNEPPDYKGDPTALAAYEQIVNQYREEINYHASLDHFGVKLGGGNMFEWAKDMKTNEYDNSNQDKDIVFVLNPEPFISAGVDPEKVDGWVYAQVEIHEKGGAKQVLKLLKPFNLK